MADYGVAIAVLALLSVAGLIAVAAGRRRDPRDPEAVERARAAQEERDLRWRRRAATKPYPVVPEMTREKVIDAVGHPLNPVEEQVWTVLQDRKGRDPIRVWFSGARAALVIYYGKTGRKNPGDGVHIGADHIRLVNRSGAPEGWLPEIGCFSCPPSDKRYGRIWMIDESNRIIMHGWNWGALADAPTDMVTTKDQLPGMST